MKIKKFRIKNYKSIIDTGECWLEDGLTIFAGKNESGKTSILEALEDFNVDRDITSESKPLGSDTLIPEISITFIIEEKDLINYYKKFNISGSLPKNLEIEIIKNYPGDYYVSEKTGSMLELDEPAFFELEGSYKENIKVQFDEAQQFFVKHFQPHGWQFFDLNYDDLDKLKTNFNNYSVNYNNSYINQIPDISLRNNHTENLANISTYIQKIEDITKNRDDRWDELFSLIPNFILFKSFEDNIPNSVPFTDLDKTEFIKDLGLISNLDTTLILSKDTRKNQKHKESLNILLNNQYSQYWSQDVTSFKIEWDSTTLSLWILEENEWFTPSQRSKGKQWHISFYIRITARAIEEKTNILLIDEPGMFLHASAQKDIYKKLLESSKDAQIIFTTHSPYLIDSQELHKVRLVVKENTKIGTTIINKIHAKADKETLTPILTAIGLELSQGIQNINQKNNIVVEGPADVLYLNTIAKILNTNTYNFIFGGGAGNLGNIGTILNGWGCNVVYLFDNDQGKKNGMKNLIQTWKIQKEDIIAISEESGAIEDSFSKEDFKKYFLEDPTLDYKEKTSEYLKNNRIDKVLLAKKFAQINTKETIKLTDETITNFKALFEVIKNCFYVESTKDNSLKEIGKKEKTGSF
ncbi:MAG: AAA family ATPase [Bacteroidia bacterium]|nr:AAA family ATPase [Bacteroidia bacterium]